MSKAKRTALVTGATGLAGGYMLAHLLEQGGWDVIAVSRRKPRIPGDYRHIAVDLVDQADCQAKLGPLTNITHLFYLAITDRADPGETISANANMFFNLVKTVEAASPALEHVHLSQGTRWYGNHLGPYKTPTKEDDPRHMPPNFYCDQQDFLEEFQKGKRWTWSVGRPHAVCGFSTGGPMNLTLAIAVYANICKALGLPLSFPGKPGAYTALYQCTDAALLAKAVEWMATTAGMCNVKSIQQTRVVHRWRQPLRDSQNAWFRHRLQAAARGIPELGTLVRAYYYTTIVEDQDSSSIRALIDWLNYNGYSVVTKKAKEFVDATGRRKLKGSMDVDLAVQAMELSEHIDHLVLFSGDGDFRPLAEAVQRRGVRVTGPMKVAVVSHPRYFERRRAPRTIDDLASHSCIQYRLTPGGATVPWTFERNGKSKRMSLAGGVTVNDPFLAVRAAVDGLGIAYTVEQLAGPFLRAGHLLRVLEGVSPSLETLFLFYPGHRQVPAALRAFIDMIRAPQSARARRSLLNPFLNC